MRTSNGMPKALNFEKQNKKYRLNKDSLECSAFRAKGVSLSKPSEINLTKEQNVTRLKTAGKNGRHKSARVWVFCETCGKAVKRPSLRYHGNGKCNSPAARPEARIADV